MSSSTSFHPSLSPRPSLNFPTWSPPPSRPPGPRSQWQKGWAVLPSPRARRRPNCVLRLALCLFIFVCLFVGESEKDRKDENKKRDSSTTVERRTQRRRSRYVKMRESCAYTHIHFLPPFTHPPHAQPSHLHVPPSPAIVSGLQVRNPFQEVLGFGKGGDGDGACQKARPLDDLRREGGREGREERRQWGRKQTVRALRTGEIEKRGQ